MFHARDEKGTFLSAILPMSQYFLLRKDPSLREDSNRIQQKVKWRWFYVQVLIIIQFKIHVLLFENTRDRRIKMKRLFVAFLAIVMLTTIFGSSALAEGDLTNYAFSFSEQCVNTSVLSHASQFH